MRSVKIFRLTIVSWDVLAACTVLYNSVHLFIQVQIAVPGKTNTYEKLPCQLFLSFSLSL